MEKNEKGLWSTSLNPEDQGKLLLRVWDAEDVWDDMGPMAGIDIAVLCNETPEQVVYVLVFPHHFAELIIEGYVNPHSVYEQDNMLLSGWIAAGDQNVMIVTMMQEHASLKFPDCEWYAGTGACDAQWNLLPDTQGHL